MHLTKIKFLWYVHTPERDGGRKKISLIFQATSYIGAKHIQNWSFYGRQKGIKTAIIFNRFNVRIGFK